MEQIEAELERVRNLGGNPKHVFLGDGNAFGLLQFFPIAFNHLLIPVKGILFSPG